MANASYITSDELKNSFAPNLDYSAFTDAQLDIMISTASRWVDSITNADNGWDQETITNEEYSSMSSVHTDADGNLHIPLVKRPLLNLTDVADITIKLGAYQTHLTLDSNNLPVISSPNPGWKIIYPNTWLVMTGTLLSNQRLYNLRSFNYFILCTYTAGYPTIPDDIKYATALATQNQMAKRFNQAGALTVRQGSMTLEFGKGKIGDESPLLSEAKTYLRNYIRVV